MRRKKRAGILLINQKTKVINRKKYNTNIAYQSRRRALKEARAIRKRGTYNATVKPYRSAGKKKFHAVYTKKKK